MAMPWEPNYMGDVDAVTQAAPIAKPKALKPWEKGFYNQHGRDPDAPKVEKQEVADPKFERVFERLIQKESAGRQFDETGGLLTSPKGAQGITQVMPKTASNPGYGVKPMQSQTKEEFIRFGRDYLQAMLKAFDGDYEKALAAYNAGPGNVRKAIKRGGERWKDYLPKKSETLPYIEFILGED